MHRPCKTHLCWCWCAFPRAIPEGGFEPAQVQDVFKISTLSLKQHRMRRSWNYALLLLLLSCNGGTMASSNARRGIQMLNVCTCTKTTGHGVFDFWSPWCARLKYQIVRCTSEDADSKSSSWDQLNNLLAASFQKVVQRLYSRGARLSCHGLGTKDRDWLKTRGTKFKTNRRGVHSSFYESSRAYFQRFANPDPQKHECNLCAAGHNIWRLSDPGI